MAERRMFAKTIIDSDAFIEMPMSARLLYYDLGMRADDDGFVNSPKKIMKMIGASTDDMNILIMRKFIIPFDSGVVVIKHWRINNYLRSDRYTETQYVEERSRLTLDEKGKYHLSDDDDDFGIPGGIPVVSTGKVSIGNSNNIIDTNVSICQTERTVHSDIQSIVDAWNSLTAVGISPVSSMSSTSTRYKMAASRLREHGIDNVLKAIENVKNSSFLQGGNKHNWAITFDWFVRPNNFIKVLDGNYSDKNKDYSDTNNKVGGDEWQ